MSNPAKAMSLQDHALTVDKAGLVRANSRVAVKESRGTILGVPIIRSRVY